MVFSKFLVKLLIEFINNNFEGILHKIEPNFFIVPALVLMFALITMASIQLRKIEEYNNKS